MRRYLVLAPLLLLVLTGCTVDTTIDIDVDADGGGEVAVDVRLDEEATRAVPDLEHELRVDDLRARGWRIDGPNINDGQTELRVSHAFDTPQEAGALIDQLDSSGGPLRDFRIEQSRSLTSVETRFSGTVDLSGGVAAWGDPVPRERAGTPLGFDPDELRDNLGVDAGQIFPMTLKVSMPGRATYVPDAAGGTWALQYGQVHELTASAERVNVRTLTYFGLSIALGIMVIVVLVIWKPYRPQHLR